MTPLYHPRPERWPQFTLRGLLVTTTLASLLMPWGIAEYQTWHARAARAKVTRLSGPGELILGEEEPETQGIAPPYVHSLTQAEMNAATTSPKRTQTP